MIVRNVPCRRSASRSAFKTIPLLAILLLLVANGGCQPESADFEATDAGSTATAGAHQQELLDLAIDNLDRLEEFGSTDVLRQIFERLASRNQPKADERLDSLMISWPEPDMLGQIVDRLNQWIHTQQQPADWKADPMTATLPKRLAELPQVKQLDRLEFSPFDGHFLQETTWLRDISGWARGDVLDDLERAKNLFDWTVRNIQIEADRADRTPQFPWETLLFGRGTATERAWVYILLLRQLDIDAAMLAIDESDAAKDAKIPAKTKTGTKTARPLRPWCVGVLIEGEAYLFDPMLGLPVPAPDGIKRDPDGPLVIEPATLKQVVADPKLLRRLDADSSHTYGVQAADVKHVVPLLEASPDYLSLRMRLLESRLRTAQRMVLTTSPSEQANRWKAVKQVEPARLWLVPFETLDCRLHLDRTKALARLAEMLPFSWMFEERVTLRNRDEENAPEQQRIVRAAALGQARMLHLKNKLVGEKAAVPYYQMARPSDERLVASSASDEEKVICYRSKQDATYWLALVLSQRGKYADAIDYLVNRTRPPLIATGGLWTVGARYNLARIYEALGQTDKAAAIYRSNSSSPDYGGELLRAKWLRDAGKVSGQ